MSLRSTLTHNHIATLDNKIVSWALFGFIIILGAVLRFLYLGDESYWVDEMATVLTAQESAHQLSIPASFYRPPAYYVPFHLWVEIFGTAEAATRFFSALIGITSIALIYFLGREMFGTRVGLVSAFLMAVSEFQIYYSQETRFSIFFMCMTLISFFFNIRALKTNKSVNFALYSVSSILLFYSHVYGVFILVAQNIFFFLYWSEYKHTIRTWLVYQALILVFITPGVILPFLQGRLYIGENSETGYIPNPLILAPFRTIFRYIMPRRYDRNWISVLSIYAVGAIVFFAGTYLFVIWKGTREWLSSVKNLISNLQASPTWKYPLVLLGCWLLSPIMLPFALSKFIDPMYLDRYTISAAPAFYILLAFGLTTLRKVIPIFIPLIALLISIAPGLQYYYVADVKEQWREAVAYVEVNSATSDVIVIAPNENEMQQKNFEWYYKGTIPTCGLSHDPNDEIALIATLKQCTSHHKRFWLVMRGIPEMLERYRAFFFDNEAIEILLIKQQTFKGVSVYLFELQKE